MIDILGYLTDKPYSGTMLYDHLVNTARPSCPAKRPNIFLYENPNKANGPFLKSKLEPV